MDSVQVFMNNGFSLIFVLERITVKYFTFSIIHFTPYSLRYILPVRRGTQTRDLRPFLQSYWRHRHSEFSESDQLRESSFSKKSYAKRGIIFSCLILFLICCLLIFVFCVRVRVILYIYLFFYFFSIYR